MRKSLSSLPAAPIVEASSALLNWDCRAKSFSENLIPVSITDCFRLQFRKQRVDFQQLAKHILNVLKGCILTHATGHLFRHLNEPINRRS